MFGNKDRSREPSVSPATPTTPESRERTSGERSSGAESIASVETKASSITLPPLQTKGPLDEVDRMEPLLEDDPGNFDLVAPLDGESSDYSLEKRCDLLFSKEHLETIFADAKMLHRFTGFLSLHRPKSMPLLIYYLDAVKALKAISYSNAVAEALDPIEGLDFTDVPARSTVNSPLQEKADKAFATLVREDLPAYITHVWIKVVSGTVQMRVSHKLPPHLQQASEGLAETFCLTDPSRKDNPIIFASEEFHRTTQYGVSYAIGRNCRFLQGPKTSKDTVRRLATAIHETRETCEVLLNYRRDGSTFLNLLMMAPLFDNKGQIRYFIGSQVDVSNLARDCTDLEGFRRLISKMEGTNSDSEEATEDEDRDPFTSLSEMFNMDELETVRRHGGAMHREHVDDETETGVPFHRPRLILNDPSPEMAKDGDFNFHTVKTSGKLAGIYQHYVLVRPYPSLRILFASPSLRVPNMLQSPFLDRINAPRDRMDKLKSALANGQSISAQIRWVSGTRADEEGRRRNIHCTPLLNQNGQIGVWMVILCDSDGGDGNGGRRFRAAPPIASQIGNHRPKENKEHMSPGMGRGRAPTPRDHIVGTMAKDPRERMNGNHAGEYKDREFGGALHPATRVDSRSTTRHSPRDRLPIPNGENGSIESFRLE
ncbi:hypothetical protein K490DRAFT_49535 [Saccharata proteae CBS 121410]|uniref:PAC domain-containing protein n=1 Tax=Saccharata proteae CBS 121410 TaxID=1314787 RepID=A0A9P4LTY8_9PEZI|nr:hypothetical protein K490DRAFT_49535 [Saccharata proteae CBS 121410]